MIPMMKVGLLVLGALAIAACGTTTFQSTWTAPDAGLLKLEEGTKIISFVVSSNVAKRRGMETALVEELREHGLDAFAAYSVIPEEVAQDAAKAKPFIDETGAAYAIVMQVTGSKQEVRSVPSTDAGLSANVSGFYSPGWNNWGWNDQEIRTDTYVGVETQLYDLKADKLVWAGQSETMNPTKVDSFAEELLRAVGDELQKAGLVRPAKD